MVEGGWGDGAESAVWNLRRLKVSRVLDEMKALRWEEGGVEVEGEDWRVVWNSEGGGGGRVAREGEGKKVWSEEQVRCIWFCSVRL